MRPQLAGQSASGLRSPSRAGTPARQKAAHMPASSGTATGCRSRTCGPHPIQTRHLPALRQQSASCPRSGSFAGHQAWPTPWEHTRRVAPRFPVSHMAGQMVRASTSTIQQPAGRCRNLASQLRPPVAKPLQWQVMQLAIFPLVQVTRSPALKVGPPESLEFIALCLVQPRHQDLLHHRPRREKKIRTARPSTSVDSLYAYKNSLLASANSLFGQINSLFT